MIPRINCKPLSVLICVLLLTPDVKSSALKEAIEEHLKDVEHSDGGESLKHDKQKGEKIHQVESDVKDTHKNQFSKATDEAKYLKKDHDMKSQTDVDSYEGFNSKKDKAEESEASGFKRGHKKGHHKQGFQNSYHKDESSNKSTFFDDENDEGDRAAYNSKLNSYDNHGGRSYQGGHNNGHEYVRDNHQAGGYNRHGDVANKHAGHHDYGKQYYLDDTNRHNKYQNGQNGYDRRKIHDRQDYRAPQVSHNPHWDYRGWDDRGGWDDRKGWNDRQGWDKGWNDRQGWDRGWDRPQLDSGWERDYGGPGYYDDRGFRHEGGYGYGPAHGYGYGYGYGESRPAPVTQAKSSPVVAQRKQTITIYEDPRYDGKDKGQLRREEGDYLELEYKPSSHRYASYDNTYYAPTREGGVESSKINKLVYNYRRH